MTNHHTHNNALRIRKLALACSLAAFGSSLPFAAQAQERVIESIVVTAQKREESSEDIGIAISTLDAARIARAEVNNIQDLQDMVPSVQIGESFGFAQVMIRGIGTDNPFAGGDPSVGMHIDGVITRLAVRRGAHRSAARPAGHPVRPQHHGRFHQRHHAPAHR